MLDVSAQMGAGWGGVFYITYIENRFRIYCKVGFCWGAGAKRGFGLTVDSDQVLSFTRSFRFMLRNANYQKLVEVIAERAFQILCMLPIVRAMLGVQFVMSTMYDKASDIRKGRKRFIRRK